MKSLAKCLRMMSKDILKIPEKACYYPEKVQELFPLDADLQKLSAQCYAGTPISNQEGEVKCILFIVGDSYYFSFI